jgi:hypothetical protein
MDNGGIRAPASVILFQQIAATIVGRNSTLGNVVAKLLDDDDCYDDVDINHRVLPVVRKPYIFMKKCKLEFRRIICLHSRFLMEENLNFEI